MILKQTISHIVNWCFNIVGPRGALARSDEDVEGEDMEVEDEEEEEEEPVTVPDSNGDDDGVSVDNVIQHHLLKPCD